MKRSKWPEVKGLWFILPEDKLTPMGTHVAFRPLGQQTVPDVLPGTFKNSYGTACRRLSGFWYFIALDQDWEKAEFLLTNPREQARWDVEYEQSCGREVPLEVLADPWLYPPVYHKGD